jgi:hypothetical protein
VRVLFDQGTPVPLRLAIPEHRIDTAYELGWSELENGELLASAEATGYEVFVTTDNNLQYQQNLSEHTIAILALSSPSWPRIKNITNEIREKIGSATPGSYIAVLVP